MMESGFVKAQSDNLPKVDAFMMQEYMCSNADFTSAEIKGVKAARSERESYGDSAVGYVQVKRDGDICVVKARITPEHNVRDKCYSVVATCNEAQEKIESVQCEDCPAHLCGCKHAIAFLAWLHRRSEDPPSTSVDCYWKKSRLSSIGTSLKLVKAKELTNDPKRKVTPKAGTSQNFLSSLKEKSVMAGDMQNQLTKYFKEPSNVEALSMQHMVCTVPTPPTNADNFIDYCQHKMYTSSCKETERATINQNDCPLWHELRYARITASKAYEAAHCKTLEGTLTESILGARKLKDTSAMKRGRNLEKEVLKEVEKARKIKIYSCGLKLNSSCPVMGASPDGESEEYSIEIKCPSTEKTLTHYITQKGTITPKYLAQVQLQMHFSQKTKALFCVAQPDFETSKKILIEEVSYDKDLCEDIIDKCTLFWKKAIFPFLFK